MDFSKPHTQNLSGRIIEVHWLDLGTLAFGSERERERDIARGRGREWKLFSSAQCTDTKLANMRM